VLVVLAVSPAPLIVIGTFGKTDSVLRTKLPAPSWIVGVAPASPALA
jgi:hypothetical protein